MRQPPLNQDIFIIVQQNIPMHITTDRGLRKKWPLWFGTIPTVFLSYDKAFNAVKRARRRETEEDKQRRGDFNIIRIPKDE